MSEEQPVKRYRGQRGPNKVKKPSMSNISMRLPKHIYDFYNGSSPAMRAVLTAWAEGKLIGSVDNP